MNRAGQPLKILQINLQHSAAAAANLRQLIIELSLDVTCIQGPYTNRYVGITDATKGYTSHHCLSSDHHYGTTIIFKWSMKYTLLMNHSSNEVTGVESKHGTRSFSRYSVYCRPLAHSPLDILTALVEMDDFDGKNSNFDGNRLTHPTRTPRFPSENLHRLCTTWYIRSFRQNLQRCHYWKPCLKKLSELSTTHDGFSHRQNRSSNPNPW